MNDGQGESASARARRRWRENLNGPVVTDADMFELGGTTSVAELVLDDLPHDANLSLSLSHRTEVGPGQSQVKQLTGTKGEAYKTRLMQSLGSGMSLWEACKVLGINHWTLAQWRATDERIEAAVIAWEGARAMDLEARMDDVFWHPEKYQNALGKPAWFNFAIARLKAVSPRYRDSFNVNVDARSVTVGDANLAGLVAGARDNTALVDEVKKQLRSR